jgi:ribonuclease J
VYLPVGHKVLLEPNANQRLEATAMTKLTFYGGVNEIGGNKVLLEDKKTRVFLDFGQSFTFGSEYFTGWLSARRINGLKDYFEFGLLPKLSGI